MRTTLTDNVLLWVGAVLLGALAPAVMAIGLFGQIALLPFTFAVTLGHSLILGLPTALLFRAKRWTRLTAAMAGGFLIGAIPAAIVLWPVNLSMQTNASIGAVPMVINGVPTLAGWFQYFAIIGFSGVLGVIGAIVFWLIIRSSGAFEASAPNPFSARTGFAVSIAGVSMLASATVFAIPTITKDRTCHNVLRDGRTSVGPKLSIDLDIGLEYWPRLTELLHQFSTSHGMSFRNLSKSQPGVVEIMGLSACTEDGLVISTNEQRWASRNYASLMAGSGVYVGLYDPSDGISWQQLSRELIAALNAEWPGKVRFFDSAGGLISEPAVPGLTK